MNNRPYSAGEHSSDPTLPHHPIITPSESIDVWQETKEHPRYKSSTGKHQRIRATSTDEADSLQFLAEGAESPNPSLSLQEPSDPLPDQQDQNR